jgi:glycosyltransferase involved in cell wall biosynthesis
MAGRAFLIDKKWGSNYYILVLITRSRCSLSTHLPALFMEQNRSSVTNDLTPRKSRPRTISVVIPCYNEQDVLAELRRRLAEVLNELQIHYEIIFVDDGSGDRTWSMLSDFQKEDSRIKIVRLSRNFGHQRALTCGVDQARGDVVLVLDADLQDPPELLPAMLDKWQEGYYVVYGKRNSREGESSTKRLFAFGFYRIVNMLSGIEIPMDTGDFRLMDRVAVDALCSLREAQRFIRGMVSWIGFPQTAVEYDRPARFAGETKYPVRKSLVLAVDAITSFSQVPLRFASYLGFLLSAIAFLYIIVVLALKVAGINWPGYTSLMGSILLLGGVQLIALGVIGEYVGRIFEQTKNRPLYFVDQVRGEPLLEVVLEKRDADLPPSGQ